MNWADYIILAALGLSVLIGLWRGFVVEAMALVVWVAAFALAWWFGDDLAALFSASIQMESLRLLLGYALVFVGVLVLGALTTFLMRKLVQGTGLSGSDRMLGTLFGLMRGLVLVTLGVLLVGLTPFRQDAWWKESRLLPSFERSALWLRSSFPAAVQQQFPTDAILPQPALVPQTERQDEPAAVKK